MASYKAALRLRGDSQWLSYVSASFATFEPCESPAMHREVDVKWLACLIAMGRPNSDLKRYIQAHCHSATKTPISIRYRPGVKT